MTGSEYESKVIQRLREDGWKAHKVDSPFVIRGGKLAFRSNPFLDIMAVKDGKVKMIECKVTKSKTRISICGSGGGITENQINAMRQWDSAGVYVCVYVLNGDGMEYVIGITTIMDAYLRGEKSIPFSSRGCFLVE